MTNITVKDAAGATKSFKTDGAGSDVDPHISHVVVDGPLPALAAGSANIGDVDVLSLPALPAGANNIGDVDVLTLPALPAGANNIGDVDVLSLPALPAGANNIGTVELSATALAALETITVAQVTAAIPAGDNNIGNVDLASALPAGTNAVGKLLPPDVDVTTHANYARKYYTSAGAVTDGIVWSPASGKRWHVLALFVQVSAAATVTLEDDKVGGDDPVLKAELAANSGIVMTFPEMYPLASGEDAADLIITTSAGNVYVTVVGYEI